MVIPAGTTATLLSGAGGTPARHGSVTFAGDVLTLPAGTQWPRATDKPPSEIPADTMVTLPSDVALHATGGCVWPVPRGVMACMALLQGPSYIMQGPVSFTTALVALTRSACWAQGQTPPTVSLPVVGASLEAPSCAAPQ